MTSLAGLRFESTATTDIELAWTTAPGSEGYLLLVEGAEVIELTDLDGESIQDGTFNLARTLH